MMSRMGKGEGFVAALDQSGGSSPKALAGYGVTEDMYSGKAEMFGMIHGMRQRILHSPAFNSDSIVGAILFEMTMDGTDKDGKPFVETLAGKGIVPIVKVDEGLEDEADGVQLMKPLGKLDALCERAVAKGVFGTKMRSVVKQANEDGVRAIVRQQMDEALRILGHGLVPILEPEVDINCPEREQAETILLDEALAQMERVPEGETVMWKLTIPVRENHYAQLMDHPKVLRVLALSGGYSREEACERLAKQHGMIASFSRALLSGLDHSMSDDEFDAQLAKSIDDISCASK